MTDLIREYLPHAPDHGLYVTPDLPADKVRNAIEDYAPEITPGEVLALYDATRLGSAKDGALFLRDRLVVQNNDLQAPRAIDYATIVGVETKRLLLGGRKLSLEVNRGRATITEEIDFAARADAAPYVERFLREAMLRQPARDRPEKTGATDMEAVREALARLVGQGALTASDRDRMLAALLGDASS